MSVRNFECFFFLCVLLLVQWSNAQTLSGKSEDTLTLRLPSTLNPLHYIVKLRPYLENNFNIDGYVEITFKVIQATDEIIIHMNNIIAHNESLQVVTHYADSYSLDIQNQTYDSQREFYIVHLKDRLESEQKYTLKLNFSSSFSEDLEGFYKTSYINSDGNKIWVAATQFQATSARRAFPCFDEPHLKATFKVFLGRREHMTAISNMPLKDSQPLETGWVLDEFETTVPMSTYLLAFVICDFKYIEGQSDRLKTKIKLWARETHIEQAEFGRKISEQGLVYLEEFFNLRFPLPKLDLVAVPEMSPNAMENWGLIIGRESGLLHTPEKGSDEHMRWVAYLICHELAHQWFGNIVTMKWWTDLWLNEGFATYIGYSAVDHIKPNLRVLDRFVVNTLQKVMKIDALKSAPPVRIHVENPQQIREIFGEISYNKGASLIRMMKYFLGELSFRTGLSKYLDELKYKSSEQDDLWNHLTKAAHENGALPNDVNVNNIMETWTSQPGFPVISVSREGSSFTLTQSPYRLTQSNSVDESEKRMWYVPITWVTEGKPEFENAVSKWLHKENEELKIHEVLSANEWILLNPKQTGYYRVNYDNITWNQLIHQLQTNHTVINVISRAQLLDDALNLAQAGLLDYNTAMNVISYLKREEQHIPWLAALNNFAYLDTMLRSTRVYGAFKAYILSVISPLYESLGLEEKEYDSLNEVALRKKIVTWACSLGHEECVQTAVNIVNTWRENPSNSSPVHRNLVDSFYCIAVKESNEDVWNFMWNRYQDPEEDPGHKQIIRNALGCSTEVWILTRYLEAAFQPDLGITRQDAPLVYRAIAKTPLGSLLAWNHLKEHWIKVRDYVGTSMFSLPQLVKAVSGHFNTVQHRNEMVWFKEKYNGNFGSAKWSIEQALESTEANIAWSTSNLNTIESWLMEKGFSSSLKRQ